MTWQHSLTAERECRNYLFRAKPTRTLAEESLLVTKRKQLAELLKQQNSSNASSAKSSDGISFYVGCGVIGTLLILRFFIIGENMQKKKIFKKIW